VDRTAALIEIARHKSSGRGSIEAEGPHEMRPPAKKLQSSSPRAHFEIEGLYAAQMPDDAIPSNGESHPREAPGASFR
jgi:hypothetical protein